jgi:hypothetical protein
MAKAKKAEAEVSLISNDPEVQNQDLQNSL